MRWLLLCFLLAVPAAAQYFSGLARVDLAQSRVHDRGGDLVVDLRLSQTVPYRVFTLSAPRRLVLDFREIDWGGVSREALLQTDQASDLRFGVLRPGWSRLVVDLAAPLVIAQAGLRVDDDGTAQLQVVLSRADADEFAARSGAPVDPGWGELAPVNRLPPVEAIDGPVIVVIDPGHGGIDPGATRGEVHEADLMLALAIEVAEALNRTGQIRAVLTRESDVFVSLEARTTLARQNFADLFISLHADALEEDSASGASVYSLSPEGLDIASQRMAERHERGDLLAGLDLSEQDDRVASVLMDLARTETVPKGQRFADTLVMQLREMGARLNSRPRREGRLAVLNAADFASVLVEVGFLSSDRDRAMLASSQARAPLVAGLVNAVLDWQADEEARAPLARQ